MKTTVSSKLRFNGFALVVTLSLMILLTVIAVGLLSLSAISLRSSSQTMAQAEARSNARLALMLAIGDLQKQMGPDQRISASGAITDTNTVKNPHWTGVWDSWKAGQSEVSQHSTITPAASPPVGAMSPTYDTNPGRPSYFRSWLLSLTPAEAQNVASPSSLTLADNQNPTKFFQPDLKTDAVWLVRDGSLGPDAAKRPDYVAARLLSVKSAKGTNPSGRYAWWIGDESQKARIMGDSFLTVAPTNDAEKIFRSQAPGSTGNTTVTGLEAIAESTQLAQQQLSGLPSLKSLDLLAGVTGKPAENFHSATPFSYQVLADVREGGLKRDLSTLLERPISTTETQDPFMLYRFDAAGQERVPIQDLAAYYQLYDSSRDPNGTKGIRYTSSPPSSPLPDAIQVAAPDYGDGLSTARYLREYTSLYRSPVPIKVQLLLGMKAEQIPNALPTGNTHRLILGLLPAVTLWNPNNVPITMNVGNPNFNSQMLRFSNLSFLIEWRLSSNGYISKPVSLAYAASPNFGNNKTGQAGGNNKNENIFDMYFSAENPIVFKPGEVRLFSYDYDTFAGNFSMDKSGAQKFIREQEAKPGWDPTGGFLRAGKSAWTPEPQANDKNYNNGYLAFRATDTISITIKTEKESGLPYALQNNARGSAFNFNMAQKSNAVQLGSPRWGFHNYNVVSRAGSETDTRDFSDSLIRKGYPTQPFTTSINGATLIGMLGNTRPVDQWKAFLQFALMAGCETNEATNGSPFAGRKFASRPFLHSSPIAPPYIDSDDNNSLYNYGWNWWVQDINSILEANVENNPTDPNQGLYGGGYSLSNGTSYVVQQEIPVTPPISIAALSHAHLGGFSISNEDPTKPPAGAVSYERTTAVGFGGLFPHTLQAIGNSYAHPNLAAQKAFRSDWSRTFVTGSPKAVTLADHSYLANKALWDEYFFSSITPQPSSVKIFESSSNRTAEQVAKDFFKDKDPIPLPNRRIIRTKKLNDADVSQMFAEAMDFGNGYQNKYGLADKIASHLIVKGPFNVNSTSVDAWKVFLSSLKGRPVAYLDKDAAQSRGVNLSEATASGAPVGPSSLPNGKPTSGSSNTPSDADQWTNWRELSDSEIEELATAMVHQVKLRGPFLSLSEFVNRRIDSGNKELSIKGALQAALDFPGDTNYPNIPTVSINAGFRDPKREFSDPEIASMSSADFPEAFKGPIAYGSAAYVDQADVLRNFSEQLTPRGDTFVIRTYGDSLDPQGKVQARAWCEAVVQRIPDYVDSTNEPHLKQADPNLSTANKTFGRKFQVVSFRWLNPSEV